MDENLPVAIVERASCPDQRVIRTTLSKVGDAVEACGSRPPGLLVTGYACEVICKTVVARAYLGLWKKVVILEMMVS